jgi:uncharacterized protein (DUF1810 family)
MKVDVRRELPPQKFIRQLFAETKDGRVSIEYTPFFDEPYTMTYEMDWTADDVENLVQRYDALTAALTRIGKLHKVLDEDANRKRFLTPQEQLVWDTYIRPFDPFDGDLDEVADLEFFSETETLTEEEQAILDRHYAWYEANCLQRLPVVKCTPTRVINHAQRYERLVSLNAPVVVIDEEGRNLAEQLALYYHHVQKPKPDFTRFIEAQAGTYEAALKEIRNGKKETHWMWFVFPQLRGLGKSSMSQTYGLADLDEAKAYLADIILGSRLRLITEELLKFDKRNPEDIFGDIDAMKLKSCMTLFAHAENNEDSVFRNVLRQYFNGQEDHKTIALLAIQNFDFAK